MVSNVSKTGHALPKERLIQQIQSHASLARLMLMVLVCVFVHVYSVYQKPFMQPRLMYGLYFVSALLFTFEIINFLKHDLVGSWLKWAQVGFIFSILFLVPSQTSVLLFVTLSYIFICGISEGLKSSLYVALVSSFLFSLVNALELKLLGAQNILTLILFNSSFFVVAFISGAVAFDLSEFESDLKTSEKYLATQTALADTLLKYIPAQVYAVNNKSKVVFSNQPNQENVESFLSDLLQKSRATHADFIKLFDVKDRQEKYWQLDEAFYFDEVLNSEIRLLLVRDQTERQRILETLRQNEKLAAIGQLAAGIAHEIRNPLAGISGSVELLSKETNNPDDKKLMNIILKEINRLNNLITEFLDYAKPEKMPDQSVDLSGVVHDVVETLRRSPAAEKVDIQVELAPRALILGSVDKLKQAVLNIGMNAIQAMSNVQNPKLKISVRIDDRTVRLAIKDNGCGMSAETQKRIFEPFFTTKAKGTGLGLALTHKILQLHQAEIQIESRLNEGTRFELSFKSIVV